MGPEQLKNVYQQLVWGKKNSKTYCPKVLTVTKFLKGIITPMKQVDVRKLVTVRL